jgi:hypothetical protein
MSVEIVLPFGDKKNVKNIVFSILSHEYPLKLIELTNYVRKRYGRSVTFQAVRKAALELVESEVLVKNNKEFQINTDWLLKSKQTIDGLYEELTNKKQKTHSVDSVGSEISVFTFESLNDLMKFWQELIDNWFLKFKKTDYPINCYQAGHVWEVLLHIEMEEKIMSHMKKKGIKSYALISNNTLLDKNVAKFYNKIGVKTTINHTNNSFDKAYYVGTYGDLIIQTSYPKLLVHQLDEFFKKNNSLENLDISELSAIVNKKIKMKLIVIKNLEMAKQINKTILDQFVG